MAGLDPNDIGVEYGQPAMINTDPIGGTAQSCCPTPPAGNKINPAGATPASRQANPARTNGNR